MFPRAWRYLYIQLILVSVILAFVWLATHDLIIFGFLALFGVIMIIRGMKRYYYRVGIGEVDNLDIASLEWIRANCPEIFVHESEGWKTNEGEVVKAYKVFYPNSGSCYQFQAVKVTGDFGPMIRVIVYTSDRVSEINYCLERQQDAIDDMYYGAVKYSEDQLGTLIESMKFSR